ncbi:hypothetical protein GCM10010304_66970 [Streptomyces roseoviolaceus]
MLHCHDLAEVNKSGAAPTPVHQPAGYPASAPPATVVTHDHTTGGRGAWTATAPSSPSTATPNRPGGTIRIGQPTQGVFSDVMERNLPNGMTAILPY